MEVIRTSNHFSLEEIENFIRNKDYLESIAKNDYGSKSNCRRAAKKFSIKILTYVKQTRTRQLKIVRDIHRGLDDSEHTKALSAYRGKNTT